jgi:HD superfamily phosphohydrolase
MKIIKDPVHGYVEIEDFLLPLLDSPEVQRLRHIRQLGFSNLVYPGANHTRFEHSVGAMHLAGIVCDHVGLSGEERRVVMAAALLHDIGHGPFSHASEPLMEELLSRRHQEIAFLLEETPITAVLSEAGIDPGEVAALVRGSHPLSGIIHGSLDVDRMDYLLRDAHYTGAPYGTVDAQRLIRHIIRTENGIVLEENGVNAAESLLIARTLMRSAVYFHHVSRIAHSMFAVAVLAHTRADPGRAAAALLREDDSSCLQTLLHSPDSTARGLAERLYLRQLYKRALYAGTDQVNTVVIPAKRSLSATRAIAKEIAVRAGIDPVHVLVDIPEFPSTMEMGVQVKNRHAVVGLEEVSLLVTTLNETRRKQWRLGVYTLPGYREPVAAAATEVLHVRKATTQDQLTL